MRKPIPRIFFARLADFRGGLNLRDDAFTLQPNELADCLNVRTQPQGGVRQRKTMAALNSSSFAALRNIGTFYGNGVTQVIVQDANDAYFSTGTSAFTLINPDALTLAGLMRFATMSRATVATSERLYVQRNAEQVPWKWDGSTPTVLADASAAYNDTIGSPVGGRMPVAKYLCTHGGFMFNANTVDTGAVVKSNRVRWSHPGEPEDYRTNDFVDVGADDGDVITGICSFAGALYIFKNRSCWRLTGLDPNTFALHRLYQGYGAVSQEALDVSPQGIFFFDQVRGVYLLDAHGALTWTWAKLQSDLLAGTSPLIPAAQAGKVAVDWMDNRVWVTVPYGSATNPNRHYIHDPACSPQNWYVYYYTHLNGADLTFGPAIEFRPPLGQAKQLQITPTSVQQLEFDEGSIDQFRTAAADPSSFNTSFRTSWFTGGAPGVKKRFKRPTFIVGDQSPTTLAVQVFKDFQTVTPKSTTNVVVSGGPTGAGAWGTAVWGSFTWGSGAADDQAIVRSSNMGNLYAVQVGVSTPPGSFMSLNAIELHYLLRHF